ncbi:tetratricopeptide repeat protein [Terriglobus albidus]|uniref:tetratricopeptide repeat protein n=1 Tax=Terriglobus albidus TaxID=1592106 RepID=UPI0021E03BB1|nr:tetratricopeptide repeat protein [Terriglobus albidus]
MARLWLLTAILFTAPALVAQETKADEVIQKAIDAMGGIEKIHALHSLIYRGFHYEGSYQQEYVHTKTSTSVMVRMRPGLRLVGCRPEIPECHGQWSRIVEGFDGRRGWELNWPKQRLVRTVNKAEHALHCGAAFDYLFIDYKERGFHASYLGTQHVLGIDVEAIQIDRPDCGSAMLYYFDPQTYAIRITRAKLPIHARGDAVDTIAVYTKSLEVNGVRLLSREEEVNFNTGDVIDGVDWTSIEANTINDPGIFQPPEVHPSGITAIVLKMLEQANHDTPSRMMAIYSSFRHSAEGKASDVVYDMNWLGYELLKVDKYSHAIPVFLQIVRENPQSADAYNNLGEAYLQKKDRKHAIAAFEQALKLGANGDAVQKKLDRLRKEQG